MLPVPSLLNFPVLFLFVFLAACGGGSKSPPAADPPPKPAPPAVPIPAPATTLSLSVSTLALKVSGNQRVLTVANTGADAALLMTVDPGVFPAGTSSATTCGSTLAPGATCTITISPGASPSAVPGVLASAAVPVVVHGGNTNTLTADVYVLDYGSFYQGGQVFAMDDTTANSTSVGGKVAAMTGLKPSWSFDKVGGSATVFDVVGVTDTSVGPAPACDARFDGACNTELIVAHPRHDTVPLASYAAGVCRSATLNSFSDWYLPAICEMAGGGGAACPGGETMDEKLRVPGYASFPDSWSSTQASFNPGPFAWVNTFASASGAGPTFNFKGNLGFMAASCVRQLTP